MQVEESKEREDSLKKVQDKMLGAFKTGNGKTHGNPHLEVRLTIIFVYEFDVVGA